MAKGLYRRNAKLLGERPKVIVLGKHPEVKLMQQRYADSALDNRQGITSFTVQLVDAFQAAGSKTL